MSPAAFAITEISSWQDLTRELGPKRGRYAFRGVSDASWMLAPSLERCIPNGARRAEAERRITRAFRARAYDFLEAGKEPRNIGEWWALMQHHGAPTRLLDFSWSHYVAAHFALEPPGDQDRALWAWDTYAAYKDLGAASGGGWAEGVISAMKALGVNPDTAQQEGGGRAEGEFREILASVPDGIRRNILASVPDTWASEPRGVVPLDPERTTGRIAVQQGLFAMPGDVTIPFMGNFAAPNQALTKYVLKGSVRNSALEDLRYMNITEASLFPGLDGFSRSLRTIHVEPSHLERIGIR